MPTVNESVPTRKKRWIGAMMGIYALLLILSYGIRTQNGRKPLPYEVKTLEVAAVAGEKLLESPVRLAYREYVTGENLGQPPVLLLHGSPGESRDFAALARYLSTRYRLIAPDLPGFGYSSHEIPDYSMRAHAHYVLQMLDKLKIGRVHVVGFSMGGGVALNIADLAPHRVASLTMLSAIGVQEMELFGDYLLNHLLHGMQLAGLQLLRSGIPHMGFLDDIALSVPYARNFYDSDQRPLRGILTRYQGPMLILHGRNDTLVPVQAALEHYRLVPQSSLSLLDENHFAVFDHPQALAPRLNEFLAEVDAGRAVTRSTAEPQRIALAARPFDRGAVPRAMGVAAVILALTIAGATLVSEDLTCAAVGVMVAAGRISFLLGTSACFLGIFLGDLLLFAAGRSVGRAAVKRAPLKWLIQEQDVQRSSAWFAHQGMKVIVASRFLPGTRLPTYFAAGLLNTSLWKFMIYFFLASAVWTPLLVGLTAGLGDGVINSALLQGHDLLMKLLLGGGVVYLITRLLLAMTSYQGRRLLVSTWRRMTRWEFWPPWIFYLPVVCYVGFLAMKYRSLTLFTAANPAMPASGFIGESKSDILRGLSGADSFMARAASIDPSPDLSRRLRSAKSFMAQNDLTFPVVLKPDVGQRGSGVAVVRSNAEIEQYLRDAGTETMIQEYIPGFEFGVFYYRYPGAGKGRIFSITEKRFPSVIGDGESNLGQLILKDSRAVCMAKFYLNKQAERLWDVPKKGEAVQLVEVGTHCRGAIFLDGTWVKTDALEEAIDRISQSYNGFYFGRYDIRTASIEDFKQGHNFKVVELNGITSEATHIYDPKNSLLTAYQVLFAQWRIAFEIGALNRQRNFKPTSLWTLAGMLLEFKWRSGLQMT
jgi:pimeloyl-ACP methyl ester carboxylesterase/membrane protein DedA with SNARE-associated domain